MAQDQPIETIKKEIDSKLDKIVEYVQRNNSFISKLKRDLREINNNLDPLLSKINGLLAEIEQLKLNQTTLTSGLKDADKEIYEQVNRLKVIVREYEDYIRRINKKLSNIEIKEEDKSEVEKQLSNISQKLSEMKTKLKVEQSLTPGATRRSIREPKILSQRQSGGYSKSKTKKTKKTKKTRKTRKNKKNRKTRK